MANVKGRLMKFHSALALTVACLAATDLPSRALPARSIQNEQSDREGSKSRLRQVLEHDPNNKEALFGLGRLLVEEGDFVSARSVFEKYVSISPAEPGAWAYLVRCAASQDDPRGTAEAQSQIERLAPANLSLHVQSACWLADSKISEVTSREFEFVMSLARYQTSNGGVWYSRLGQCYENVQDRNWATRAFEAAIDLDPATEGHYFRLAHLLASEGMAGPASKVMTRAVARFPRSVATRVEAGRIELEAGNPERALEIQYQAAALDPQFPGVLSLLGRIQLTQRSYPEAIATLEQAAKLAPGDAAVHFYAGQASMKTEQGTERAIEHFKRSLELDPNRASTYYWLGSLYFHRSHEYRVAIQYLEQAVGRGPELGAAHQMLIQAYKRLGEDEKAAGQLRRYQEIIRQRAKVEAPK
ncbi:MAG TPA: tetratricopeptide repeat protein [Candidatus Acidoferrum sp.]